MAIEFADIAHPWQKGANIAAYTAAGHDRILVKEDQGTGYTNPALGGWWRDAGTAGLARGLYHFATPLASSGSAEADHFAGVIRALGGLGPRDWVCLDTEQDGAQKLVRRHAFGFVTQLATHGITRGVIYSGFYYLQGAGLLSGDLPAGWRQLHLASYNNTPDVAIELPPGWFRHQLVARQYTDSAITPGIPGPCDRSRVVREWLTIPAAPVLDLEDEIMTMSPADRTAFIADVAAAVAPAVLGALRGQMWDTPNPPHEPNPGAVFTRAYQMTGEAVADVAGVAAQGVAAHDAAGELLAWFTAAVAELAPTLSALDITLPPLPARAA